MSFFEKIAGGALNTIGLGTGLAIGGTVLEHEERESQFDAQLAWQQEQLRRNEALQREFAQHGVTWRVEDAKRAGVHPLFALGGAGAAYSAPGITVMGEDVSTGAAIRRTGQDVQNWLNTQMTIEAASAAVEKDRAQAGMFDALAAKAWQDAYTGKGIPEDTVHQGTPNLTPPMEGFYDKRVVKANPVFSRDSNFPSVGAGSSPGFRAFEIMPGKMIDLPHSEEGPSEALENLGITSWPFVIAANIMHYGSDWLKDMASIITPFIEQAERRAAK